MSDRDTTTVKDEGKTEATVKEVKKEVKSETPDVAEIKEEKKKSSEGTNPPNEGNSANGVKTEPCSAELEQKIIKQIEYYFGDVNLNKDKFLQEKIKEDDGWVPLATLLTFNRLKSLSEDPTVITGAISKSTSGIVEVSSDGLKIRRSLDKPLPDVNSKEWKSEHNARSIYAKGFPLDVQLEELEVFFAKFGTVENIQMRKDLKKKKFKGSVFVMFIEQAGVDNFMKPDSVKYKEEDDDLLRHTKADYFKKKDETKSKKNEEIKKSKEEQKLKKIQEEQALLTKITHGAILCLTGFQGEITLQSIKDFFNDNNHGHAAWVDLEEPAKKALVRFKDKEQAKDVLDKLKDSESGKLTIIEQQVEGRVLEGAEELEHWKKIFAARTQRNPLSRRQRKRKNAARREEREEYLREKEGRRGKRHRAEDGIPTMYSRHHENGASSDDSSDFGVEYVNLLNSASSDDSSDSGVEYVDWYSIIDLL